MIIVEPNLYFLESYTAFIKTKRTLFYSEVTLSFIFLYSLGSVELSWLNFVRFFIKRVKRFNRGE